MYLNNLPNHELSLIKEKRIPVYSMHTGTKGYISAIEYHKTDLEITIEWDNGNKSCSYPHHLSNVYVKDLKSFPLFTLLSASSAAVRFFEIKHYANCAILEHNLVELIDELNSEFGNYITWENNIIKDLMFSYGNAVYSLEEPISKDRFKYDNDKIRFRNKVFEVTRKFKEIVYKHTKDILINNYS